MSFERSLPPARNLSEADEVTVGAVLDGRFALRREAGRGGVCVVYEAEHVFTGRIVAIKVLLPEHARNHEAQMRLLREARALGSVSHPGVVDVLDAGVTLDGVSYIVMERVEGKSLDGLLLARGRLSVKDALAVVSRVADAVGAAHRAGVVHRDIKPGNILITVSPQGVHGIKVIDFGIAAMPVRGPTDPKLTATDSVLGTPEYMAPEQLMAGAVTSATDVYSLGITLFECLAGVVPIQGNYQQVLVQATTEPIPSIVTHRKDIPVGVINILHRALEREPEHRYRDANELAAALVAADERSQRDAAPDTVRGGQPPVSEQPAERADGPRRKHKRAGYITPIRLQFQQGSVDGRSEDLSEGGLLAVLDHVVPEGGRVILKFALPGSGQQVACSALVRWVRSHEQLPRGKCAVGLEFLALDPSTRTAIDHYVRIVGRDVE